MATEQTTDFAGLVEPVLNDWFGTDDDEYRELISRASVRHKLLGVARLAYREGTRMHPDTTILIGKLGAIVRVMDRLTDDIDRRNFKDEDHRQTAEDLSWAFLHGCGTGGPSQPVEGTGMKIDNEKQEATAWDESAQRSPTRAIEQLRYDLFDVVIVYESLGSTRNTGVDALQAVFRTVLAWLPFSGVGTG